MREYISEDYSFHRGSCSSGAFFSSMTVHSVRSAQPQRHCRKSISSCIRARAEPLKGTHVSLLR